MRPGQAAGNPDLEWREDRRDADGGVTYHKDGDRRADRRLQEWRPEEPGMASLGRGRNVIQALDADHVPLGFRTIAFVASADIGRVAHQPTLPCPQRNCQSRLNAELGLGVGDVHRRSLRTNEQRGGNFVVGLSDTNQREDL